MATEIERRVLALLRGGLVLDESGRRSAISELGPDGLDALRRIASGELDVEHPQLRLKAIAALGFDEIESEASREALRSLLQAEDPRLALHALRALDRSSDPEVLRRARDIVTDMSSRPDVALAAARIAARTGGADVVPELRALRARLLALVPSELSPSIQSLDRMIAQATGQIMAPDRPEPKLDV